MNRQDAKSAKKDEDEDGLTAESAEDAELDAEQEGLTLDAKLWEKMR